MFLQVIYRDKHWLELGNQNRAIERFFFESKFLFNFETSKPIWLIRVTASKAGLNLTFGKEYP